MSLSSIEFLLFLICALLCYYLVAPRFQWCVLLLASAAFYCISSRSAAAYLCITILLTYGSALLLQRIGQQEKCALSAAEREQLNAVKQSWAKKKRTALKAALTVNFFTLFLFKYFNWLLSLTNSALARAGAAVSFRPLSLLLPLGISFYIFQTSGYLLDVYRGKITPERNLFKYALFVSYFPQIVQGPINRFDKLQSQLLAQHRFRAENIRDGIELMIWGMLKKAIVADRLAPAVSELYTNYSAYNGTVVFFGAALYCLQLYCDFSGGIDLVRGASTLFDIELAENFRRPYFSKSVDEFWRRWHMSLGEWMKDYVFYPLALSKGMTRLSKKARKHLGGRIGKLVAPCVSTVVVFLLVGIWQGPGGQNIAYGLWNGLIMSASMLIAPLRAEKQDSRARDVFMVLHTCCLVTIGRFFSNSASLMSALGMLRHSVTACIWNLSLQSFLSFGLTAEDYIILLFACCVLLYVSLRQERGVRIRQALAEKPLPVQFAVLFFVVFTLLAAVYLNSGYTGIAYVYENV